MWSNHKTNVFDNTDVSFKLQSKALLIFLLTWVCATPFLSHSHLNGCFVIKMMIMKFVAYFSLFSCICGRFVGLIKQQSTLEAEGGDIDWFLLIQTIL